MKGFIALKSFYHDKQYYKGDKVEVQEHLLKEWEERNMIRWIERPDIIMPKEVTENDIQEHLEALIIKPKQKKRVRKSKKRV